MRKTKFLLSMAVLLFNILFCSAGTIWAQRHNNVIKSSEIHTHSSTLYVNSVSVNWESRIKYLYSPDISRNAEVLYALKYVLSGDFADLAPSVGGEWYGIAVSNLDNTPTNEWISPGYVARLYYSWQVTSISGYAVTSELAKLNEEAKERYAKEEAAEAENLAAYNERKAEWEAAQVAKMEEDPEYTPVDFPEEYVSTYKDEAGWCISSNNQISVDKIWPTTTSYIIRDWVVTQVDTTVVYREKISIYTEAVNVKTYSTYNYYTNWWEFEWWNTTTWINYSIWETINPNDLLVPSREWYTFLWWYTEAEWWDKITWHEVWVDMDLYAQWKENERPRSSGWWSTISRDKCPNWDYSDSYYDWTCGEQNISEDWQKIIEDEQDITENEQDITENEQEVVEDDTMEQIDAYKWWYDNWILEKKDINMVSMKSGITRIVMAKMLSQYAIKVLWMKPDTASQKSFSDVSTSLDLKYDNWVTLAYQLWIMWINMWNNFRPYDNVTRAEFATALSRLLYHTPDWDEKYYTTHMAKLQYEWIITNTNPTMKELRGYVMLMLMRSAK